MMTRTSCPSAGPATIRSTTISATDDPQGGVKSPDSSSPGNGGQHRVQKSEFKRGIEALIRNMFLGHTKDVTLWSGNDTTANGKGDFV